MRSDHRPTIYRLDLFFRITNNRLTESDMEAKLGPNINTWGFFSFFILSLFSITRFLSACVLRKKELSQQKRRTKKSRFYEQEKNKRS